MSETTTSAARPCGWPSPRAARAGSSWIELPVAPTALAVSTASLFVARHHAQVMARQLAASVWPLVGCAASDVREGRERFEVQARVCYCSVFGDRWMGGPDIERP